MMASEVIQAYRNKYVLVNMKWGCDSLCKNIYYVIIGISSVIKLGTNSVLPLLCLQNMLHVGSMKHETLKIQLPHAAKSRPRLEINIGVVTNAVLPFEKPNLGIEIRTDLAMLAKHFKPTILVVDSCSGIRLS